ncbi:MAG TPA: hypothetical protein VMZ06_18105 [Candidatus Bathyarchaeia archaeon]|nr:hypothetical protein [Candidatus Bathyarchaeia archaeon]
MTWRTRGVRCYPNVEKLKLGVVEYVPSPVPGYLPVVKTRSENQRPSHRSGLDDLV